MPEFEFDSGHEEILAGLLEPKMLNLCSFTPTLNVNFKCKHLRVLEVHVYSLYSGFTLCICSLLKLYRTYSLHIFHKTAVLIWCGQTVGVAACFNQYFVGVAWFLVLGE